MRTSLRASTILVVTLAALVLAACGQAAAPPEPAEATVKMAPASALRSDLRQLPQFAREAYQLALANEETLNHIPCYCGCGSAHSNVRECFVSGVQPDGRVAFDLHGAGCGICQDIVHDSLGQIAQGRTLKEARAFIDARYGKYGPPTDTPPVQ